MTPSPFGRGLTLSCFGQRLSHEIETDSNRCKVRLLGYARLAQQVREAGKMGPKFGAPAVVIDNRQERTFLDMVCQAATDRGYEVCSESVTYRTDEMGREPLDAFCKSARFAPENEFRIALMGGEDVGTTLHPETQIAHSATGRWQSGLRRPGDGEACLRLGCSGDDSGSRRASDRASLPIIETE